MSDLKKIFDPEDRLVVFACLCPDLFDFLPETKAGNNLEYQLSKHSTSSALNYGKAQAADSKADFLHKMKIVLKEIRESGMNLRIIIQKPLVSHEKVHQVSVESNQLIAVFLKSTERAKNNKKGN